ncbi:hypothetical protein [Clostridium botulinum]|uniref:hypothetical protein n=1 Tax=Clostridium botulinum TaxID=1491 RepID=UPI001E4AB62B|nr:hypothetical protein [Clostridium botulinum]MCD3254361.1 hypothetical protein [Clostridium botulinum C/D]MCD3279861.1 hypothetical protein [Clostridium botulinum C/D]MCD3339592.1 hypothetical protein [Clostridium botulinum C/D]MCD3357500.1 hypothetical protein [Clostridium botulinum C/D]
MNKLDRFMQERAFKNKLAERIDTSNINLTATGQELKDTLEMLFVTQISDYTFRKIQFCMNYNKWTLEEIIEYRSYLDNKSINPCKIVSVNKSRLEDKRKENGYYTIEVVEDIFEATHWIAKKDERWKDKYMKCGVLQGNSYKINYQNDDYKAPYIIDDFGRESYIFLAHEGDYVVQKVKKP